MLVNFNISKQFFRIYAKNKLVSGTENILQAFREAEDKDKGLILLSSPKRVFKELVFELDDDEIIKALNKLDPDKATDVLQNIEDKRAKIVKEKLSDSIREKVEFLLRFNPRAAAGLMSLDYIKVKTESRFEELKGALIEHEKKTGKFPTILIEKDGKLMGELPGHELVLHGKNEKVGDHIQKIPSIKYNFDERKVINSFLRHPHNKIIVLDDDGSILGVIHSDDILALIDRKSTHDLYGFAGVNREEDVLDSVMTKVKFRYRWLILNLGTAFLAASVVGLFQDAISKLVLLAVYMPIVAGMGGNAGTQTLAVTIRGLVLKEINPQTSKKIIANEMGAGAINGLINGVLVALIAVIFNKNPAFGLIIGIAMVVNLVIAGFFGALVPIFMKAVGKDPASSATIFITTATDVFGFFVFLGLARMLLI